MRNTDSGLAVPARLTASEIVGRLCGTNWNSPPTKAGIADHVWSIEEIVGLLGE
jgi:hypothetical protein